MPIKVLLTKIGIDAHDRGVKIISHGLRNAGMEVIYTGPWQTIDSVVRASIQEDVNVIGISTLGGDYLLIPELMKALKEKDSGVPVILGGIVPTDVVESLKAQGVADIFHPGTSMEDTVRRIQALVNPKL